MRNSIRESILFGLTILCVLLTGSLTQKKSYADSEIEKLSLRVHPEKAIAPKSVTFNIRPLIEDPIASIKWDFEGDGVIDLESNNLKSIAELEKEYAYKSPGVFSPSIKITTLSGKNAMAKTTVEILDKDILINSLQNKWIYFVKALREKNIKEAVKFVSLDNREQEKQELIALQNNLKGLADVLDQPLEFKEFMGVFVIMAPAATVQIVEITYPLQVTWIQDHDGKWRIESY